MGSQCNFTSILGGSGRYYTTRIIQGFESKKLEGAGYYYANSGSSDTSKSLQDSATAWGIIIENAPLQEDEDDDFVVFYDAWRAVELFFKVQTQWLCSMDGIIGLNYASVIEVIKLHEKNKKKRIDLLDEVSAFERGYLKAVREKREKNRK